MAPYGTLGSGHRWLESFIQTRSRKGNCDDNAVMESFFGTLKAEHFYLERSWALADLQASLHDYVAYYNHERIKIGLNG